jgi:ATP synthase protein I
MTTETTHVTRDSGVTLLLGAAGAALVVGVALCVAGALLHGSAAAYGALVGTAIAVGVFSFGTFMVNLVAGMVPPAALLVALLTYTLQVVLLGLVFVGLSESGLLDGELDRTWLGAAVITTTGIWLLSQIVLFSRRRVPVFDLPPAPVPPSSEGDTR